LSRQRFSAVTCVIVAALLGPLVGVFGGPVAPAAANPPAADTAVFSSQGCHSYAVPAYVTQVRIDAVGDVKDGRKVVAKMKEMPTEDPLFGKGHILANGRKVHDVYVFQVKSLGIDSRI